MNRRHFFALASGPLVPWEPERIYSFLPAWRLVRRDFADIYLPPLSELWLREEQIPGKLFIGFREDDDFCEYSDGYLPAAIRRDAESVWARNAGVIHPSNLLDVQKSLEAYGYPALTVSNA